MQIRFLVVVALDGGVFEVLGLGFRVALGGVVELLLLEELADDEGEVILACEPRE